MRVKEEAGHLLSEEKEGSLGNNQEAARETFQVDEDDKERPEVFGEQDYVVKEDPLTEVLVKL